MKSSLPRMTKSQRRRIEVIKQDIGCIACRRLYGLCGVPADAHHLIDRNTGKRISHDATIPLCKEHHEGNDLSIHKTKRKFAEDVGADPALLFETNRLYEAHILNTIGGSR